MAHRGINQILNIALPQAEETYSRDRQTAILSVLRLLLNQILNAINALIGKHGHQYIDTPNGLFFQTGTQTLAAIDTGYPIEFNNTYLDNGISIVSNSRITVETSGIYNFQYAGELTSTNASAKNVYIWINRDGTDIGYSTHAHTISGSSVLGSIEWNFIIDLQADSYIELYWAASDTNVTLSSTAAAGAHPGIPASVCTVKYVSALPDELPTPP